MKILLDANFLLYCAKQKIDYISEMPVSGEIVVLSSVAEELEKIKEGEEKAKDKRAAEISLHMLDKNIKEKKMKIL